MRIDGTSSNNIVIEGNTIKNNGVDGIYIKHSDYFYLGNNTISGSGTFDLRFSATTIGNSAKNTTFSTISVHSNAYFAIYNDLTLKFMQNATVGFDELDVKLVSDSSTKYATSYYGGSDSKTNTNGLISTNFTLKFRIYDGTSTPDEATTTLYYHYGVRAKAYNLNMTTSHTETVSVPSYWKDGLVENLDSGLKSATIQDAIDNASSGDTLKLWSWNYVESDIEINERVTIIGNSSGTVSISANWENSVFNIQTNTITLKNLTLKRSSNSTDEACIKTTVGTGILIDNVLMNNCGIGILVKTSNVVISNVTIEDSVTDGIVVKNTASNVRIENSTIKRSGDDGIQLESNVHLYNNTISSNTNRGIYVISGSDYAKIRYNTIDDNDEQGVYVFGVHHVEIRNNVIEDNQNYGIQLKDANYTQIRDNTVDDNDGGLDRIYLQL